MKIDSIHILDENVYDGWTTTFHHSFPFKIPYSGNWLSIFFKPNTLQGLTRDSHELRLYKMNDWTRSSRFFVNENTGESN